MAGQTFTTALPILKEYYSGQTLTDLCYQDRPLLALMPKNSKAGGSKIIQPVAYARTAKSSSNFTKAYNITSKRLYERFEVDPVPYYTIAEVDGMASQASRMDTGAFVEVMKAELDGAMGKQADRLATYLYVGGEAALSGGAGCVGVLSSVTSTTGTLSNVEDSWNFEVDDTIVFSPSLTGSGDTEVRNTAGTPNTLQIVRVDRTNGQIFTNAAFSTAGAIASDNIFFNNDKNATISGLGAWMPATAPSVAENFFGVDRSVDTRLAGLIIDGRTYGTIEEALIAAGHEVAGQGGKPSHIFMNTRDFGDLCRQLASSQNRPTSGEASASDAAIGFSGVKLMLPKGEVLVLGDKFCPRGTAFVLQLDTWKVHTDGELMFIDDIGGEWLKIYNDDTYQARVKTYGNVVCSAPGWNARVRLA